MKVRCNDDIVRNFRPSTWNNPYYHERVTTESICLECKKEFGIHDTKILKPIWKKHSCNTKSTEVKE